MNQFSPSTAGLGDCDSGYKFPARVRCPFGKHQFSKAGICKCGHKTAVRVEREERQRSERVRKFIES